MKRKLLCLSALVLCLSLLFTGCNWVIRPSDDPERPKPTDSPDPTHSPKPTDSPEPIELPDDFDPSAYPDAVAFSEIEYQRPDVQRLIAEINDTTALIKSGATGEEILDAIYALEPYSDEFSTMDSVSYICYCENLSDTFYKEEYDYLENQAPLIQQALELLYEAAAECPDKEMLEEEYFGDNFLDFYLEHDIYTNDEFVKLAQKEAKLQTDYMQLQENQTIMFNGEECLLDDLMEEYEGDYNTLYNSIYPAYFAKYNASMGEIYVQLVQTRQAMAKTVGYDSYADFAYEYNYGRDYTPQMAREYIEEICDELAPLYMSLRYSDEVNLEYDDMDFDTVIDTLKRALYRIDSAADDATFYEFFSFMEYFELWDATESSSKMSGSYETYLPTYAEPFVYISPTGTESDFMTLAHEFGHFSDSMINDNEDDSLDKCEIFSQAMEAIALSYSDFDKKTVERLKTLKLLDLLEVFVYQGMYADFEDRVYQLDPDTITVDIINDTYADVVRDYGMYAYGMDWYNKQVWVDINHFFIAPDYIISYCTSADVALQIFSLEDQQKGDGLDKYMEMIELAGELDFLELLDRTGMTSPFDDDRVNYLESYFEDALK
ncbi:MAG: M3 family metallopeptidase [Clostridia bacterium]|nr:M3 family metallopeptidase [Clostridia bacterium]